MKTLYIDDRRHAGKAIMSESYSSVREKKKQTVASSNSVGLGDSSSYLDNSFEEMDDISTPYGEAGALFRSFYESLDMRPRPNPNDPGKLWAYVDAIIAFMRDNDIPEEEISGLLESIFAMMVQKQFETVINDFIGTRKW